MCTVRGRDLAIAGLLILLAIIFIYRYGIVEYTTNTTSSGGGLLIVTTFPSLDEDLSLLSCTGDRVVGIYPPGTDPHELQLGPKEARMVMDADLIVTGGHTPVDLKAEELARGVVINFIELDGVKLIDIPGGPVNSHYPIYDPDNYMVLMRSVVGELSRLRPECSSEYSSKLSQIADMIRSVSRFRGALNGSIGVVDLPSSQYPAAWLGVDVELVLVYGHEHGGSIEPGMVESVDRILSEGGIAFVTVDDSGAPVSKAGEWLMDRARMHNATVVLVKAPYTRGTVIEKLEYIAGQVGIS